MKVTSSFYCLDCVCGQRLRSETRDLVCTACGRKIRIEWPAEAETPVSDEQALEAKGAAA
jgi:DNA-directed RNA polymerase subunit RPC12/RpoP